MANWRGYKIGQPNGNRKIDEMWFFKNTRKKHNGRPSKCTQDFNGKEVISSHKMFEINMENRPTCRRHCNELYKKQTGILDKRV